MPKAANGVAYDVGKKFQKGGGKKKSSQTIEIFKGDTLWGLSRKYGVGCYQLNLSISSSVNITCWLYLVSKMMAFL